jgi:HK97 family phage portal protein
MPNFFTDLFFKRSINNNIKVVDDVRQIKSFGKSFNIDTLVTRPELNSTVFTCIDIISNTISKCDIDIFKLESGKKVRHINHRWYDALKYNPDFQLSTKKWLGFALTTMYLEGNFFAYLDGVNNKLKALPMPEKIFTPFGKWYEGSEFSQQQIKNIEKDIWYKFPKIDTWFPSKQLIHFYLITKDQKIGLNPIDSIRPELSIQKGGEGALMNHYSNGLMQPMFLEADLEGAKLAGTENSKVREYLNDLKNVTGWYNNNEIFHVPPMYKLKQLPVQSLSYLENNKYSISQVGALFKVPEAYLGIQNSQTYGKAAEQVAFFNTCLSNVCAMVIDELSSKLLTVEERNAGVVIEFNFKKLYDTDLTEKTNYLKGLFSIGSVTPNEVRDEFNLERDDSEFMDYTYMQAQYLPVQLMDKNNLLNKNINITNIEK